MLGAKGKFLVYLKRYARLAAVQVNIISTPRSAIAGTGKRREP